MELGINLRDCYPHEIEEKRCAHRIASGENVTKSQSAKQVKTLVDPLPAGLAM